MRNIGLMGCIALLLGVIASLTVADAIEHYSYAFSKQYKSSISSDTLSDTPQWEDDAENPPVSARRAIALADAKRKEMVKDSADYKWHRKSATLIFDDYADSCYWRIHYVADFRGNSVGYPNTLDLYVLMDGRLIEPVVSERNDRDK